MRLQVGPEATTRLAHLLLGVNGVLVALFTVLTAVTPRALVFAGVVGVLGVYNLVGVAFPAAVVFPTVGANADRSMLRFVHGMGVVFYFGIGAALSSAFGLLPITLLVLLTGVYEIVGLAIPGLYLTMGFGRI